LPGEVILEMIDAGIQGGIYNGLQAITAGSAGLRRTKLVNLRTAGKGKGKDPFRPCQVNPTSPVLALGEVLPEANVYTTNG